MTEQNLSDLGLNMIRTPARHSAGRRLALPRTAASTRQIQIDLDTIGAACARGLSAQDVSNALDAQNLINPVGTQKIGGFEYTIQLNNAPSDISRSGRSADQGRQRRHGLHSRRGDVRDGNPPQTNIVHVDGSRSVLLSILKNGAVSTLAIIQGIKDKLAGIKPGLPDELKICADLAINRFSFATP